jgi:hypothetical protein
MKYRTKKERLIAIVDAYQKATGKTAFTIPELSKWAILNELWPVPTLYDGKIRWREWETKLEQVQAESGAEK